MIKSHLVFSLFAITYLLMSYSVKEIFYSLQGEGARVGRAAVFCRFSGCNLWSGIEQQRNSAECNFCDTDFNGTDGIGGGKFNDVTMLANTLLGYWPESCEGEPYVVFTGGEPLLQLDTALIKAMQQYGFEVAVETNGTVAAPAGIDWLCVSPKGQRKLVQTMGNELKLVFPQADVDPAQFRSHKFEHFYLQPLEEQTQDALSGPDKMNHIQCCTEYCLSHPGWKLSLQIHKTLGIR